MCLVSPQAQRSNPSNEMLHQQWHQASPSTAVRRAAGDPKKPQVDLPEKERTLVPTFVRLPTGQYRHHGDDILWQDPRMQEFHQRWHEAGTLHPGWQIAPKSSRTFCSQMGGNELLPYSIGDYLLRSQLLIEQPLHTLDDTPAQVEREAADHHFEVPWGFGGFAFSFTRTGDT
jgi:hypothetical protein